MPNFTGLFGKNGLFSRFPRVNMNPVNSGVAWFTSSGGQNKVESESTGLTRGVGPWG